MTRPLPNPADVHTIAFDFDGVFTNNKVWVDQDGRESVCCDRADGLGMDMLHTGRQRGTLNAEMFILTRESNSVVAARARKLRLDCKHPTRDKLTFMTNYLTTRFPDNAAPFSGLVYLGNDLNDLPLMHQAGCSVAPSDAHPRVLNAADLVLPQRGGDGFVRAFVEQFLGIDQLTDRDIDELISDR